VAFRQAASCAPQGAARALVQTRHTQHSGGVCLDVAFTEQMGQAFTDIRCPRMEFRLVCQCSATAPAHHSLPCNLHCCKRQTCALSCTARQEHRSRSARSGGNDSQHWRACSRAVPGRAHLGGLHVKARRLWCRRERRRRSARVGRLRQRRAPRVGALPRLRPIGWPRAARRGPGGVAVRVALGIGTRRCAWIPRRRRRPCTGAWEFKGAPVAGPCTCTARW